MNASVSQRPFELPPPPPPPRPSAETLSTATPAGANTAVAGMDAEALSAFNSDVQALPASERQGLLNDLAAKLDAPNLVRLHDAFGQNAVTSAVDMRAGADVREAYQSLVPAASSGPTLPQGPSGMPPPDIARIEGPQIRQAQEDFAAEQLDSGAISAPWQMAQLLQAHATEPAYQAELVRLADEAGVLDSVMAPNWGLFSRDGSGGYAQNDADMNAAREAMTTAIGVAVERGVLSEGGIRHAAADNGAWGDVAGRLQIGNVGRTEATREAGATLETLAEDYASARKEVDKLNEELNTFLLRAGPLTPEQQAKFIEEFRNAEGHAEIYAAEAEAGEALASYVEENRDALLEAAIRDPAVAQQVVDMLGQLAEAGKGELALELLGEITAVPDSALGEAFAAHADTLTGELFEQITGAAAVEVIAKHGDDLQGAIAELKELLQPFKDAQSLFKNVKGGIDSFTEGLALLDKIGEGDYDALQKLADGFGDASPFKRALSAAGVVIGAVKAADSLSEGDYLQAINGFASAGESGLNLLAGATKHFADAGRLAQYGDDTARALAFATRLAPALGVVASATSMILNAQKAGDGANVGYAIAAIGDAFSVMGSAVSAFPGGQVPGILVNAIGTVISTIGGFVGDQIEQHQNREELRGYMEAAGVDPAVIDQMLYAGEAAHEAAEALGLDAEGFQALIVAYPDIAASPGHLKAFTELATAAGIPADKVADFADALAKDNADFAWDVFGIGSNLPVSPSSREAALRDYLENAYPTAAELAESESPELFGEAEQQREAARFDYEQSSSTGSYELAIANNLIRNDDPAYRAETIRLLDESGRLEIWAEHLAGYGDKWAEAARASLDDAVAAGVIDQATADRVKQTLG
ncbi:hypothetical protein LDO26_04840 [Luteimonas sp. BDR2-5]|uniref:hypothetical protein n=1 Tax=Proluteimonas luteida TaxID=2878685 RepID=UPI001E2E9985|nr:hypothetical protein [Luteimonas sp. BDR2-5]MCD9027538.1 hypothetical protein [Luteimonas sp. BDR2-5]